MVRYGGEAFAIVKVAGFLLLQGSLAVLVVVSVWSVFTGSQENFEGEEWEPLDDEDPSTLSEPES